MNNSNNFKEDNQIRNITIAENRWLPKIIQDNNTNLYDMIANPYKYGLLFSIVIIIVLVSLFLFCINNKIIVKNKKNKIVIPIIFIIAIIIGIIIGIKQHKKNKNIKFLLKYGKKGLTKYHYKLSKKVKNKILRNYFIIGCICIILGFIIGSTKNN